MFKVRVPATTANMGAGFDSFGMAFNIFNEITVEESDNFKIEPNDDFISTTKDNLIYKTMLHYYKEIDKPIPTIKITQNDKIPLTRGLGSSAACVVAGLVAANKLAGNLLNTDELLQIASDVEGHPDNVAPALLGGLVVAAYEPKKKVNYVKINPPEGLSFVALIPDFALSTKKARSVLPTRYSRADMVFNISRASLFIASMMSGKWENLNMAIDDKLHQPYRKALVPGMGEVFNKSIEHGALGVYLSGAGPTVMAVLLSEKEQAFTKHMSTYLKTLDNKWNMQGLQANYIGAELL